MECSRSQSPSELKFSSSCVHTQAVYLCLIITTKSARLSITSDLKAQQQQMHHAFAVTVHVELQCVVCTTENAIKHTGYLSHGPAINWTWLPENSAADFLKRSRTSLLVTWRSCPRWQHALATVVLGYCSLLYTSSSSSSLPHPLPSTELMTLS